MATRIAGKKKGDVAGGNGRARPLTDGGDVDQARIAIKALGKGAYEEFEKLREVYNNNELQRTSQWLILGTQLRTVEIQWKLTGLNIFCKHLGIDPKEARMAIRASERWTADELAAILRRARAQGGHITWAHVRIILGRDDDQERERYLQLIEHQKLSQQSLIARIKADKSPAAPPRKKGGRTYNIPTEPGAFYEVHVQHTGRFRNYIGAASAVLPKMIAEVQEDTYNDTLLGRVQAMRATWEEVAANAAEQATQLADFERQVERKLGLQPPDSGVEGDDPAAEEAPAAEGAAPAHRTPLAIKNRNKEQ